jgi:hypothetical protein
MTATLILAGSSAILFFVVFFGALVRDAREYHPRRIIEYTVRQANPNPFNELPDPERVPSQCDECGDRAA